MNYFQLVLKQMRQRALSTWLTTISVMLGVGLAIAIMVIGRESQSLFGQSDYGYDAIIGKKASKLQLVLNTVYHLDISPGNIPFSEYTRLLKPPGGVPRPPDNYYDLVKIAVPTVVGDTLNGQYRIVGTLPKLFGFDDDGNPLPPGEVLDYRPNKKLTVAEGKVFEGDKFEAIVGSDIPRLTGVGIGSLFQATHTPAIGNTPADIHVQKWKVVGVLAPTHTAIDRVVYIPMVSFYTIAEHGAGLTAQAKIRAGEAPPDNIDPDSDADHPHPADANGLQHFSNYDFDTKTERIKLKLSPEIWALSAILVQTRGGDSEPSLEYNLLNNGSDVMACNPAAVMREFFDNFLKPSRILLLVICSLVTIVAAVGILVSIYNSVSARLKEIAILRALGATRTTVLTLICLEAGLIALIGSALGVLAGHGINGLGAWYMLRTYGENLDYNYIELVYEALYVVGVILLAIVAGFVPAMKAYRTPVATNLVAA